MSSLAATAMVRDDEAAKSIMEVNGIVVPPVYEIISTKTGINFRQMFMGWVIAEKDTKNAKGAIVLFSSVDGEDYEIMSVGGWNLPGARELFRTIFVDMNQTRVTARCLASNTKNISVLKKFGFRQEGIKRMTGGNVVLFGMFRDECRLLKEQK